MIWDCGEVVTNILVEWDLGEFFLWLVLGEFLHASLRGQIWLESVLFLVIEEGGELDFLGLLHAHGGSSLVELALSFFVLFQFRFVDFVDTFR